MVHPNQMYGVCVIGHATRDVLTFGSQPPREMPGGASLYTGIACQRLGLNTAVITKMRKSDAQEVSRKLAEVGAGVFCLESEATTVFKRTYSGDNLELRDQQVVSIANVFESGDLGQVRAKCFHLGPLTNEEMSVDFLKTVCREGGLLSLDVQGFVRKIEQGRVELVDWPEKQEGLGCVNILKAHLSEAQILSGEVDVERAAGVLAELGPDEVIVTMGGRGSFILADGRPYKIPAYSPRVMIDPTGCGDSYAAGYIYYRLQSDDVPAAGRFAAALATLKLERHGPFVGDAPEVRSFLRHAEGGQWSE